MPEPSVVAATLALERPPRLGTVRLIAIDGPSGSGKTTFAGELGRQLTTAGHRVEVMATDLLATWDEPFDWWPRLEIGVLQPFARGEAGQLDINDWTSGEPRPGGRRVIAVPDVLILEGVSAGRRQAGDVISVLIWVEISDRRLRLERAVARDGEAIRPHLLVWQRQEEAHFIGDATRARADLLIDADPGAGAAHRATVSQT